MLATNVSELNLGIEIVVSPAMGGLIIGHETARSLDLPSIFTERADGVMKLRRGFVVREEQRVLIVEDVVTTGKSTREVIAVLHGFGARVVCMASMVNRSGIDNPFAPLPYVSLFEASFPTWHEHECPLCAEGLPIDKPGSRPSV
jgi:orotate phosphoribosyltransferase